MTLYPELQVANDNGTFYIISTQLLCEVWNPEICSCGISLNLIFLLLAAQISLRADYTILTSRNLGTGISGLL